jgi:hypothetical protein
MHDSAPNPFPLVPPRREIVHAVCPRSFSIPGASTMFGPAPRGLHLSPGIDFLRACGAARSNGELEKHRSDDLSHGVHHAESADRPRRGVTTRRILVTVAARRGDAGEGVVLASARLEWLLVLRLASVGPWQRWSRRLVHRLESSSVRWRRSSGRVGNSAPPRWLPCSQQVGTASRRFDHFQCHSARCPMTPHARQISPRVVGSSSPFA